MNTAIKTIDQYIRIAPEEHRALLQKMRSEIATAAPKAIESIKYGMPTFELNGNLVHFAAMKGHLGFYPAPSGIIAFKKQLEKYDTSKGCIRFSYDKPVPFSLVKKIVTFRVKENLEKNDFPTTIGAPAMRALHNAKINNLKQLVKYTEKDILALHGMGPKALGVLKSVLRKHKLNFALLLLFALLNAAFFKPIVIQAQNTNSSRTPVTTDKPIQRTIIEEGQANAEGVPLKASDKKANKTVVYGFGMLIMLIIGGSAVYMLISKKE